MINPSMLETRRLLIRIDTEADYIARFRTDPDEALKAYFGLDDDQLQAQREKIAGGFSTYRTSICFFHLLEKEAGTVLGSFAYHNWYPAHHRSEIGYAMASDHYKQQGFMKEAFPAIMAYGFEQMHLNRMEAFIHPDNVPSRRLVEGAGFTQEGRLREHYTHQGITGDSLVYGMLRRDYEAQPGEPLERLP